MTFDDQLDMTRTAEGRALQQGWDDHVQSRHRPDVYWDPTDLRWETYAAGRFSFTRTDLPAVDLAHMWSESLTLSEVLAVSRAIRASGGSAIWNPRDGRWYRFHLLTSPPPPPPGDGWTARMNAQLAAIEADTSLSPEERHRARIAIIDSYT
jgi:hypothetical protein